MPRLISTALSPQEIRERLLQMSTSDAPAVITQDKVVTYRNLIFAAFNLSCNLEQAGVRYADRVMVELPNSFEFLLCYFACLLGGYTIVPINTSLSRQDKLYIESLAKPKITIGKEFGFMHDISSDKLDGADILSFLDAQTIYSISFTSGTTGKPKGICHSTVNIINNVLAFNHLTGIDHSSCLLHVMPMGYMAGFLNTIFSPLFAGGTVVLAPVFSVSSALSFWDIAMKYSVNTIWLSPSMAGILVKLNRSESIPIWTRENLKRVFVGTAPFPASVEEAFESTFGVPCYESYGMSEVMLVSCQTPEIEKNSCVGHLLDGIDVKFGRPVMAGDGELYIRTPFILKGYLSASTELEEVSLIEGCWFSTGDVGHMRANRLFITGRIKDLIIRGGVNVSPRALEETLLRHPSVKNVAVIGIPDSLMGEKIIAFVVLDTASSKISKTVEELFALCVDNHSSDAYPSKIISVTEMPLSSTGKVAKQKLKQAYLSNEIGGKDD